jgi:hypothetical protein
LSPTPDLKWYDTKTGGLPLADSIPLVHGNYYAAMIRYVYVEYPYQKMIGCPSAVRATLAVNLLEVPPPAADTIQGFKPGAKGSQLVASGANVKWYQIVKVDTTFGYRLMYGSETLINDSTYYATQTISGCSSWPGVAVHVKISDDEEPPVTGLEPHLNSGFYPNPVKERLYLSHTKEIDEVSVVNPVGQRLLVIRPGRTEVDLDFSNLPPGMYLIHMVVGDQTISHKVIKQ